MDQRGWAFDFLADELIRYAGDRFKFSKAYKGELPGRDEIQSYDLIYSFWWGSELQKELLRRGASPTRLTTVISSLKRWESGTGDLKSLKRKLRKYSLVGVISRELQRELGGVHPRLRLTRHGVDVSRFSPKAPVSSGGALVVGWAGSTQYAELKGLDTIIRPAIEGLKGVELALAVKEGEGCEGGRSFEHAHMQDFYNSIDVYLCASSSEGCPLPVLEAASCGRTVVSTRVGIVPELIEHAHSGFLVDRDPAAFRAAIEVLRDEDGRAQEMGRRAREEVEQHWSWEQRINEYITFFEEGLSRVGEREKSGPL